MENGLKRQKIEVEKPLRMLLDLYSEMVTWSRIVTVEIKRYR